MPLKQQLDKSCWHWAETVDPAAVSLDNIKTAYRLSLPNCQLSQCKRNCKGNPFCINAIGERVWFGKIDDKNWHDVEDPEKDRRPVGTFVGLKNLGATCYVNTFLQLWFHNPIVQEAIYQWREKNAEEIDIDSWKPSSVCGHMQVIFALLQLSSRRYIDPSEFIQHLGLDAGQQQDAQEFSKLFLSVLEENLMQSSVPDTHNVIRDQFCGSYAYVTKCSNCDTSSERVSDFYELDLSIRGHKTLEEAVKGFLEVEKLEGDNQYMCGHCNSKQNATRAIQLKALPPVLNLQLLRFVFEKNTGQKKKLNSFIQFPDVLEMGQFLAGQVVTYDLSAVLIHRGPSAYSGHYIAHIRGKDSQTWYKFNDEDIEKIKGRGLQLGNEEDPVESKQKKGSRTPKGNHSSRNAYMLVYTKRDSSMLENSSISEGQTCTLNTNENQSNGNRNNNNSKTIDATKQLPPHVLEYVQKDNDTFENWIKEMEAMKLENIESGKQKQADIKTIFSQLVYSGEGEFEWLPLNWLTKWLSDPTTAPPINNKPYTCVHGRVDPEKTGKLKCVSVAGVDSLFSTYGGGPRLTGNEWLCETCVRNKCNVIRTKKQVAEDDKLFTAVLKSDFTLQPCYWVGKASFRSWRRLALERLSEIEGVETKGDEMKDVPQDNIEEVVTTVAEGKENQPQKEEKGESDDDSKLSFNEDLLCACGQGMEPDPACRRLIPEEVWVRVKKYFPGCPEFKFENLPCEKCQTSICEEELNKDLNRQLAVEQKAALVDLYHDKRRPLLVPEDQQLYVISSEFAEDWRQFIKNPQRVERPVSLMNSTLLCRHGNYLYPPEEESLKTSDGITYLWPQEWVKLQQFYQVDSEITVFRVAENSVSMVMTVPTVCDECLLQRLTMEERQQFNYREEVVYVRKVQDSQKVPEIKQDQQSESGNEDDPDFKNGKGSGKKRSPNGSLSEPPQKVARAEEDLTKITRKGQRHRRTRGEKEVKVSSSQTLKQLKLEIMKLFAVPPFDQNLFLDGMALTDDSALLGELRIAPGSVITLKADEAVEDPMFLDDISAASGVPESGFKGTGLLST